MGFVHFWYKIVSTEEGIAVSIYTSRTLLCIGIAIPISVAGLVWYWHCNRNLYTGGIGKSDLGLADVFPCNFLVTIPVLRLKLRQNGKSRNHGWVKEKKRCEAVLKDTRIMGEFFIRVTRRCDLVKWGEKEVSRKLWVCTAQLCAEEQQKTIYALVQSQEQVAWTYACKGIWEGLRHNSDTLPSSTDTSLCWC